MQKDVKRWSSHACKTRVLMAETPDEKYLGSAPVGMLCVWGTQYHAT